MEMTKRYMKIILMVFPKIISEKLGHFLPHKYGLHNSGPASLIFFKILNNWRGRELGHNLMIFSAKKKSILRHKFTILDTKVTKLLHSGSALRIFCKICALKWAKKYIKIILMLFWGSSIWGVVATLDPVIFN